MEVINVAIENITPYQNNAKRHPKKQIDRIIKSIEEFGYNDPIAIDENNIIIEGHGRFEAVKQLGYTQVPCIQLKHLTEEQRKAYTDTLSNWYRANAKKYGYEYKTTAHK